jgi:hypothetical protein
MDSTTPPPHDTVRVDLGERVYISHKDMWHAARDSYLVSSKLVDFEHACGIEFEASHWKQGTYVYRVVCAKRLMAACVRYGWRVTQMSTS